MSSAAQAGAVATVVMTLVILAGRLVGSLRTPPPKEITHRVEEKTGVRWRLPEEAFRVSWVAAHFG